MKYLVIDDDGQIRGRTAPRYDVALREVGPEGSDRVGFPAAAALVGPENLRLAAYVNDSGLLFPDRYSRNLVGSCVLATFGANVQPYAGPVLFVGWDALSGEVEIESLSAEQIDSIREVHTDVRIVLGLDDGTLSRNATPRWQAAMAVVAEVVRTGPAPRITVLYDDDALAYVRRAARGGGRS
jgi:hypothetical protein